MSTDKQPWQVKRSELQTEKDVQKTIADYLDILQSQGKLWHWHDKTNDKDMLGIILSILKKYIQIELPKKCIQEIQNEIRKRIRNKAGLTDELIIHNQGTAYLELKSPKGTGKLTPEQQSLIRFLDTTEHNQYHVSNDIDDSILFIDSLTGGRDGL